MADEVVLNRGIADVDEDYSASLLRKLMDFREERSLCDVHLIVDGVSFSCHKILLAVSSLYFKHLFSADMTEKNQDEIQISNVSPSLMKILLDYIYTGNITMDADNVRELIIATDYLLMHELKEKASKFLTQSLSAENAISLLIFSERYSCHEMMNTVERFICENFQAVSKSEEYLSLDVEDVAGIIARDDLQVKTEEVIFDTIVEWVRHNSDERREEFPILLGQLRLTCMSKAFLTDVVRKSEYVCDNAVCLALVNAAIDAVILSEIGCETKLPPRPSTVTELLIIAGGVENRPKVHRSFSSSTCYCHIPETGTWFELSHMKERRFGHGIAPCGQYVYAAGGHNSLRHLRHVERLDLKTGSWSETTPMLRGRSFLALTANKGMLYALGGRDDSAAVLKTAHRYNPMTTKWEVLCPLTEGRCSPSAVSCSNSVYVIGGRGESECLNTVEKYLPDLNCWLDVAPMTNCRMGASAVVNNDKIFVIGGTNDCFLRSCEVYHPEFDTWHDIVDMPKPRAYSGVASLGKEIYIVGGRGPFKCYETIDVYNVDTEKWRGGCEIPTKLSGLQTCTVQLPKMMAEQLSEKYAEVKLKKKKR